ncbi:MAG TPA: hypothetical protein VGB65_07405 [Allosphingosinicella sp.]
MTRTMRLLATASTLAAAAFAATPAFAEGTAAGTTITNTVSLSYKVGNIDQNGISASNTFTVDRKVVLTVAEVGNTTTSVSPGQLSAVTTFDVTNGSNAPLDFALAASQPAGGTAKHGGTDNFNVSGVKLYRDANANGSYDAGTDVEITYLDQVTADEIRRVFVVADVPLGRSTGDVAGVRLTATAAEATAAAALGAIVTQTAGANTAGVDTVFADSGATGGNVAYDGIHFDEDDYTILAASLTATKTSRVISDPVNGTTNPKMIPGAIVEYCIAVANGAGSAPASNITVSDTLPTQTAYNAAFGIKVNGTVTGTTCNADGVNGGGYAAGVVSGTLQDVAASSARTLVFRVAIN